MAVKNDIPEIQEEQEELVTIRIPLLRDDQSDVFVRVNHRTWLIKRGVPVQVPKCVLEVIENSEKAELEAMEYQSRTAKD